MRQTDEWSDGGRGKKLKDRSKETTGVEGEAGSRDQPSESSDDIKSVAENR